MEADIKIHKKSQEIALEAKPMMTHIALMALGFYFRGGIELF